MERSLDRVLVTHAGALAKPPELRAIHPTIGWAKFKAMVEGARLASETLWHR